MNRNNMVWVKMNTPVTKLSEREKEALMKRVADEMAKTTKLQNDVSRIQIKKGRIYLFSLHEQPQIEGVIYTVPLIDGKYIETTYARITILNSSDGNCCSLDWQSYDNKWMTLEEGSLEECIQKAELSEWIEKII